MLNKEKTITISFDEYNRLLESQKQVDELTVRTSELFQELQEEKRAYARAVKDVAKDIYSEIGDDDILVIGTQEYGKIEVVPLERLQEILKSKGVEVE